MTRSRRPRPGGKDRSAVLCVVILLTVVCLAGILAVLLLPQESAAPEESGGQASAGPAAVKGQLPLELDRTPAEEGQFRYLLNGAPQFGHKGEKGSVYLENCTGNKGYMEVTYTLEDGRLVYRSPRMAPNSCVERDSLCAELPEGEYGALAKIFVYDSAQAEEPIGIFEQNINLTVG